VAHSARCSGNWKRRFDWLLNGSTVVGVLSAAVVYLAPFLASGESAGHGFALVVRENVQRFFAPHNHRGPVYLYAYVIFGLLAPWSVFLPAALVHAHSAGQRPADRFALTALWVTFVFYTLSASRRSYYLLPILPAAALLIARLLTTPAESLSRAARLGVRAGWVVVSVAVGAAGAATLPRDWLPVETWRRLPELPYRSLVITGWLGGVVGVLLSWRWYGPRGVRWTTGVVATAAIAYWFVAAQTALECYRGERAFVADVRRLVGADAAGLTLHRTRELSFYLGYAAPVAESATPAELRAAVAAGQARHVVLRRRHRDDLGAPATVLAEEVSHPWESAAARLSKAVLLRVSRSGPEPRRWRRRRTGR
jgi:4-amino-4-deoxy-L-arabinose transferase-like glycosyltransferase